MCEASSTTRAGRRPWEPGTYVGEQTMPHASGESDTMPSTRRARRIVE